LSTAERFAVGVVLVALVLLVIKLGIEGNE
jgi:hypothetical protein